MSEWTPYWIKVLRKHLGYSQQQMADALGFGSYQRVSELENGKRQPSPQVGRLLDALKERIPAPVPEAAPADTFSAAPYGADAIRVEIRRGDLVVGFEMGSWEETNAAIQLLRSAAEKQWGPDYSDSAFDN